MRKFQLMVVLIGLLAASCSNQFIACRYCCGIFLHLEIFKAKTHHFQTGILAFNRTA